MNAGKEQGHEAVVGDEAGNWALVVEVVDETEEGRPAVPLAIAVMEGGSEMTQSQGSQTRAVRTR